MRRCLQENCSPIAARKAGWIVPRLNIMYTIPLTNDGFCFDHKVDLFDWRWLHQHQAQQIGEREIRFRCDCATWRMFITSPQSWSSNHEISWYMKIHVSPSLEKPLKCQSITLPFLLIKFLRSHRERGLHARAVRAGLAFPCRFTWVTLPMKRSDEDASLEMTSWPCLLPYDFVPQWWNSYFIFQQYSLIFSKLYHFTFSSASPACVPQRSPPRLMPWYRKDTFAACCRMVRSKRTIGMVC